jgi:hypothetical protein
MIQASGGVLVPCALDKDDRCYNMDLLRSKLNENTRLLIVNSPSNPTGGVMTDAELEEIGEILKDYPNCWVLSDEIYSRLVYDGASTAPSMLTVSSLRDRLVVVDGFSKTYSMTGWRLGYAVCPKALGERLHLMITHSLGCTAAFTQIAGCAALDGPQDCVDEMVAEYQVRGTLTVLHTNGVPGAAGLRRRPPERARGRLLPDAVRCLLRLRGRQRARPAVPGGGGPPAEGGRRGRAAGHRLRRQRRGQDPAVVRAGPGRVGEGAGPHRRVRRCRARGDEGQALSGTLPAGTGILDPGRGVPTRGVVMHACYSAGATAGFSVVPAARNTENSCSHYPGYGGF